MEWDRLARAYDVAGNVAWLASTAIVAYSLLAYFAHHPKLDPIARRIALGSGLACACVVAVRAIRDAPKLLLDSPDAWLAWVLSARPVLATFALGVVIGTGYALFWLLRGGDCARLFPLYVAAVIAAGTAAFVYAYLVPW